MAECGTAYETAYDIGTDRQNSAAIFAAGQYYDMPRYSDSEQNGFQSSGFLSSGYFGIDFFRERIVAAADGGAEYALKLGLKPDFIVGDFDSISENFSFVETGCDETDCAETGCDGNDGSQAGKSCQNGRIIRLPACKDDTDLAAAIKICWEKSARIFHVFGATGGRIDHTLANIALAESVARRGGVMFLYGDDSVISVICDGELKIGAIRKPDNAENARNFDNSKKSRNSYVSVFARSGNAEGVTLTGLKYAAENETMFSDCPLGTSNEMTENPASIKVEKGCLCVVFPLRAAENIKYLTVKKPAGSLGVLDRKTSERLNI